MAKVDKLINFSAVIFDMDGLVLDTETTYCIAWNKALIEMGYTYSENFCLSLSGLHYKDVERQLCKAFGEDFDLDCFNTLSGQFWLDYVAEHGITVKKGFFNLLARIREFKLPFCLATNSRQSDALECLQLANLEGVFSDVFARDHVKQGKPAADIFLLAAKTLNISITDCLVLEDSKTGLQAANKAGAISVFVPSVLPVSSGTANLADYVFNDLDEVSEIIKLSLAHPV